MGRQVMFVLYDLLATTDLFPPENPIIPLKSCLSRSSPSCSVRATDLNCIGVHSTWYVLAKRISFSERNSLRRPKLYSSPVGVIVR